MTLNEKIAAYQKGEFPFLSLRDEVALNAYHYLDRNRYRYTEDEINSCLCSLLENLEKILTRYQVTAVPFENYLVKTITLAVTNERRQQRQKNVRESVYLNLHTQDLINEVKEPNINYGDLEDEFLQLVKGTMSRIMKKLKPQDYHYRLALLLLLLKSGYYLTEGEKERLCQWGNFDRETVDDYLRQLFLQNEQTHKKYNLYQIRRNRYVSYLLEPTLRPTSENLNFNLIQARLTHWNQKMLSVKKAPKNHQLAQLLNIDNEFVDLVFKRVRREEKRVCSQY